MSPRQCGRLSSEKVQLKGGSVKHIWPYLSSRLDRFLLRCLWIGKGLVLHSTETMSLFKLISTSQTTNACNMFISRVVKRDRLVRDTAMMDKIGRTRAGPDNGVVTESLGGTARVNGRHTQHAIHSRVKGIPPRANKRPDGAQKLCCAIVRVPCCTVTGVLVELRFHGISIIVTNGFYFIPMALRRYIYNCKQYSDSKVTVNMSQCSDFLRSAYLKDHRRLFC